MDMLSSLQLIFIVFKMEYLLHRLSVGTRVWGAAIKKYLKCGSGCGIEDNAQKLGEC